MPQLKEQPVDSMSQGLIYSMKLKLRPGAIHADFIKKDLPFEVMFARDTRRIAYRKFKGIDAFNESDFPEEIDEYAEAGDRVMLLTSKSIRTLRVVRRREVRLSDIISAAVTRNVYYSDAIILMESLSGSDLDHYRGIENGSGILKLNGWIKLRNCSFERRAERWGKLESVVLDSIDFSIVSIDRCQNVHLGISNCTAKSWQMSAVAGDTLVFDNNKFTESFLLSGNFKHVVINNNTFGPPLPPKGRGKAIIGESIQSLAFANNSFDKVQLDLNSLKVTEQLVMSSNLFGEGIALDKLQFPYESSIIAWQQFQGMRIATDENNNKSDSEQNRAVDSANVIRAYQKLIHYYEAIGDQSSLKECRLEQIDFQTKQFRNLYDRSGGLGNYINWKLSSTSSFYYQNTRASIIGGVTLGLIALVALVFKMKKSKTDGSEPEKRLAALIFSDIVGYTTMMGQDEERTLGILKNNKEIHMKPIRNYHGRLLKEMGDGMLFSFMTASDAVNYCIEVQRNVSSHNGFKLRMGVHLGEVMFTKGDVIGDGVNIASRLEQIANSGDILISDTVYQNIRNQQAIVTEYVGERELKNVVDKVKVYSVKY